ncbi:hypothetical protein DL764_008421 [Monosporascus ibericus]|uniref:Fungal N-terminal domain-containing protein n=1 Tax=Monosporascus ibericus TaxID=155417 RepID=A0A4Q4SZR6_9PEZI|nr:hypothetical protein DL764_008421 [Monosporascus ibericus]
MQDKQPVTSRIAWKLAQAFTNGRKSAPSEFREVENQLYALNSALKALSDAQNHNAALTANGSSAASLADQDEENARWDTIRIILNNCHETLKHLESFTEKYGIVVGASDISTPRFQRWREDLFKNWKKVMWTKEAGALATLRSQVVTHTNSLNLILGVINNSQTTRIESGVQQTSKILKEIYAWYTDNLKDVEAIPRPHETHQGIDYPQRRSFTDSPIHTFELTVEIDDGQKPLCGCASLKPDGGEEVDDTGTNSQRALLACCCPNETASHRATVEAYGLSHRSFQVRLAGKEMTWLLCHIADRRSNRLVEMRIRGVTAAGESNPHYSFMAPHSTAHILAIGIPQLEERFRQLFPMRRVEDSSQDDTGGELTHVTSNEDDHVLALIGSISRDWVEDVQILLYSVHNNTHSWDTTGDAFRHLDFAEILVYFCEENQGADNDVERTALKFKHDTPISLDKDDLTKVGFLRFHWMNLNQKKANVVIAAEEFHARLEDMREELFILYLNYPRPDETAVLHLQSAQVECEDIFIVDASITIVHDSHGKYRLIIVSRNKCTVLSQVLADDFFSPSTRRPSFASPTWVVQIEGSGIRRIYHRQNGLRFLDFRSTQSNRMFELGCSTVSMNQHAGELITDGMDTSEN